uniref:Ig-like domain-containing protein n=1 Tax=Catagonus wagneri TaxID=51154 RepID=A0A8C3YFG4_9CETA
MSELFSRLTMTHLLTVCFHQLWSLEGVFVVEVGRDAHLPCNYSPATPEDLVPVCWGKGSCPLFACHSLVLSTNGGMLTYQTSSRYLLRNVSKGDVTLTIKKVTLADSGTYCCRVQFPGLMNDQKTNLELVIKPGEWASADLLSEWDSPVDHMTETQTLETLYGKDQTEMSTLANELQDVDVTTRTSLSIGVGVSAGLAFILISGALILKFSSVHFLVTLANLPPLGLPNTEVEGMHSEAKIYIVEENVYEMEDPYEYEYCDITDGQQS